MYSNLTWRLEYTALKYDYRFTKFKSKTTDYIDLKEFYIPEDTTEFSIMNVQNYWLGSILSPENGGEMSP